MNKQNLPATMPDPSQRTAWLQEQWRCYAEEPESATALLQSALNLYANVAQEPPSEFGVLLTLFLCELQLQVRQHDNLAALIDHALAWVELGVARQERIALLSLQCRMHLFEQRHGDALSSLAQLTELTRHSVNPLELAQHRRALAQTLFAQRDYRRALELYRETVALHRLAGDPSGWVGLLAHIVGTHRALGERAEVLSAYVEYGAEAVKQRRWMLASQASAGIAEEYATNGASASAEQALADAREYANRPDSVPDWLQVEIWAAEAICFATRQDLAGAVALMLQVIETCTHLAWYYKSRRLRQIVPWLLELGRPKEAAAALESAHRLELGEAHEVGRRELATRIRRVELEHALAEQARSAAQALEMAGRQQALAQALTRQHELQTELIEASKLATLGNLLAGISHELNTPLGNTLTAISTVVELSRQLGNSLRQGPLSRKGFERDIGLCEAGSALARRNIERALELIASYHKLNAAHGNEPWLTLQLDELIQTVWSRSVAPDTALRLAVDADLRVPLHLEALTEVLRQLFQNVERHAYAAEQAGLVQVHARIKAASILLTVSDSGHGIAAELLPRIFDPYVSTQFGKGRSGLGLFVARAAAGQGLHGKLRVQSSLGMGSRFELSWPLAPTSEQSPIAPMNSSAA